MTWFERVIAAHTSVTEAVSHCQRMKSKRYFVWQEDGARDLAGDDRHAEGAVSGSTDLFTMQEFDPWAEELGEALSSFGIAWSLRDVQFEEETGFYHYTWDWEVPCGKDQL